MQILLGRAKITPQTLLTHELVQILLGRAEQDYAADRPPPLRFIRSCSSALAAATLHKVEAAFHAPVLEVSSPTPLSV